MTILPRRFNNCEKEIKKLLAEEGLEIDKPIGTGAQGIVYGLRDTQTAKITQVLKVTTQLCLPHRLPHRLPHQGLHLVENIHHPNICTPTKIFYVTGKYKLVTQPEPNAVCIASIMPYVKGVQLRKASDILAKKAESIFTFGLLLADAVLELSNNGVEHSDLHFENILVENAKPTIIDFDYAINPAVFQGRYYISDRQQLREHVQSLIEKSSDMKPEAKHFLLSCLKKAEQLDESPDLKAQFMIWLGKKQPTRLHSLQLMKTFMAACIDHLDEIQIANYSSKL